MITSLNWLTTDTYQDVRESLRSAQRFVTLAKEDGFYWKWFIIALHSAIQGAMVIALTRTDGFGAMPYKVERKWQAAYAEGRKLPEQRLMSFLELYDEIKRNWGAHAEPTLERFVPNKSQETSMEWLNSVRNDFIHFTPKGWSLNLGSVARMGLDCVEVARYLVTHSSRFRVYEEFREGELPALIDDLERALRS